MEYQNLLVTVDGAQATLTFNRPDVRNALDLETVRECHDALIRLAADERVGVLIFTGAGDKAFVSGADIRDLRERRRDEALAAINQSLFAAIDRFPRPTIAAINGVALGGGCELALACDIRVASENARFGQPELALGIIPAAGGTQRLPRVVGLGRAKHLILTGEIIDAREAHAIGLVTAIVPPDQLMARARDIAERILRQGPLAARLAKLALNASARVDLDSGLLIETLAQAVCFESEDKLEGTTAFLEKRKPTLKRR